MTVVRRIAVVFGLVAIAGVGVILSDFRQHREPSRVSAQYSVISNPSQPATVAGQPPVAPPSPPASNLEPRTSNQSPFLRFLDWSAQFVHADAAHRAALESEGIVLATERRAAMVELIQQNPERALQAAIPFGLRAQLPDTVTALLEERISGRGLLDVWAAHGEHNGPCASHQGCATHRFATIGGREFKVFTHGRRLALLAQQTVSMHGIVVDDLFALHEDPVRILEPGEAAAVAAVAENRVCPVSGLPGDMFGEPTFAQVGDEIYFLCQPEHAEELNAELADDEMVTLASAWTEGEKKVLFIRVDYSDDTGSPVSANTLTNTLNASSTAMQNYSYGRTRLAQFHQGSDWTPVLRMPNTKTSYSGLTMFLNHAKNAAQAAGFNTNNYNFHVVCSKKTPVSTANALARVGSSGILMNGGFSATLFSHEVGHNYGVWHANFWQSTNPYGIGSGSNVEYGDIFDIMGGDAGGWNLTIQHFNVDHKTRLGWIKSGEFATASGSGGLYRIYAHDNTNSLGKGLLALKVPNTSSRNVWVEYRQRLMFPSDNWIPNGVGIRWGYNVTSNNGSRLIDTTPGSRTGGAKADRRDSPLVIGRTFSDDANGVHITPIGLGNTSPQSIDVRVNLGTFSGNRTPVSSLSGRTSGMIGETLTFTANASDPDGDALAYHWDFGNDQFDSANSPTRNKSWSAAGAYTVRCTVSDMKGGVVTNSMTVSIISTPVPPAITSQPQSRTNLAGANVTFTVAATGTAPLSYQWRFNATNSLAGATGSSYTLNDIQPDDAGAYSVVVSNGGGSVTSANAMLTVVVPIPPNRPPLLGPMASRTVHAGSTVSFTASAYDPDDGDTLAFSLDAGAPAAAGIHAATGAFAWTTSEAEAGAVHPITVRVTDDGEPPLSGTATFSVEVLPKPGIDGISMSEGGVTLSWSTIPNEVYRVQYKNSLSDSSWTTLGPDITATGTVETVVDNLLDSVPHRFYRILVAP